MTFTKNGDLWVATQEVNDDYNLHLECASDSTIVVYQKTAGNAYAPVHVYRDTKVVDDDFDGLIYPKTIKVTSSVEPSVSVITELE